MLIILLYKIQYGNNIHGSTFLIYLHKKCPACQIANVISFTLLIDPSKVRIPAWSTHAKTTELVFTWMTLTHVTVWKAMKGNTVRQVGREFLTAIFIPIVYASVS